MSRRTRAPSSPARRKLTERCRQIRRRLEKQGWLPADATALQTALATLSGVVLDQDEALADRVQFTAELTRAANTLYKLCQACQNAARLQYPETKPSTAAPPSPLRPHHPHHRA